MEIVSRKEAVAKGFRFYYTGKPCKRGHTDKRWTQNSDCFSCNRENGNRWKKNNPDKVAESSKIYIKENKENIARYQKKWHEENRERQNKKSKEYRKNNRAAMSELSKQYYLRNKEKQDKYNAEWQSRKRKTPEGKTESFIRRNVYRLIKKESSTYASRVGYSASELRKHIERQFTKGMSWDNYGEWHIDHIIPIAQFVREGVTDPCVVNCLTNLRPMWAKENSSKGDRIETLF